MEEVIRKFVKYLIEVRHISDNTRASYQRDVKQLCVYLQANGINSWADVSEDMLSQYMGSLNEKHYLPATISRHAASIRTFFHFMVENGDIDFDPSEIIKSPEVIRITPTTLSITEIEALLDAPSLDSSKGKRDKTMLQLLASTGMKASEIIELTVSDINFQVNCVSCGGTNHKRLIPFGKKARECLLDYMENAREEFIDSDSESDILFPNCVDGKRMSRQGFWKLVKGYAKKAQIETEINTHILRHTFAKHLIDNGADLQAVQEILGHIDISTTSRYAGSKRNYLRDQYSKAIL